MVFLKVKRSSLEVELGETTEEKARVISELVGRTVRVNDSEQGLVDGTNRGDSKNGRYNVYNWNGDFFLNYDNLRRLYLINPTPEEKERLGIKK